MAIKLRIIEKNERRAVLSLCGESSISLSQLQEIQKLHLTGPISIYATVFSGMPDLRVAGKLRKRSTLRK